MLTTKFIIQAGNSVKFHDLGDFLRLLVAFDPVTIRTFKNGQIINESVDVTGGFAEGYKEPFQSVEVYSATTQEVQIALRFGSMVYYDQAPSGNVTIANANGAFSQGRAQVTNANEVLLAANPARRALVIQNNDPSVAVRFTLDGSAATISTGFRIPAGDSYEAPAFCVTGAVNVCMETATTTADNVEFAEG